jgi:hypothetical protein
MPGSIVLRLLFAKGFLVLLHLLYHQVYQNDVNDNGQRYTNPNRGGDVITTKPIEIG